MEATIPAPAPVLASQEKEAKEVRAPANQARAPANQARDRRARKDLVNLARDRRVLPKDPRADLTLTPIPIR